EACQRLWAHARDGNWAAAVELSHGLSAALAQIEDNPTFISLIKQALSRRSIEQGPVRPPLPTADSQALETLLATITALEKGDGYDRHRQTGTGRAHRLGPRGLHHRRVHHRRRTRPRPHLTDRR